MWEFLSQLINYILENKGAFGLLFGSLLLISLINIILTFFKVFGYDNS